MGGGGGIITMPISTAIFAGVYLVIVVFLVSNGPENFKCISDKERDYIMKERTQKTGERVRS